MIDLRLLQAATMVADERNVTRAADRLGLTQSALSKQLAELEERVGFVLFERSSQKFSITPAGAAFVEHARNALSAVDRAVHSGRAAALGSDDVLGIVKSPYVDPYFISIMGSLRLPLYPKLQLRFSSHFSADALRMLRSGEADLAVTIALSDYGGFTSITLCQDLFYVAFLAVDPLYQKREVTLADLESRRLALFERHVNPAVYDRLQTLLAADGIHVAETQHVQNAEEAAALIVQRRNVALLTKGGAWRVSDGVIAIRPLADQRLVLKTFLSARNEDESRLVSDFTRAFVRKLSSRPEQAKLAFAS